MTRTSEQTTAVDEREAVPARRETTATPATTAAPVGSAERWKVAGVCIVLIGLVLAVFGGAVRHDFVNYDDDVYVYRNPWVTGGLTWKNILWAFTHVRSSNWHPLTWMSHMLDCQIFGLNPAGHHFINILLHTATVVALFLVLRRMTGFMWRSAFVAAVFAIHPLRVESVAWVAERKDVLSGLFFVLTIGAYARYAKRPWSAARYGAVLLLFALGLVSKPMLVTLPFVLVLLDFWPLKRFQSSSTNEPGFRFAGAFIPKRFVYEKLPMLGLVVVSCVITLFAQEEAVSTLPISARAGNALVSYVVYLKQMFYPMGLAVFYSYPMNGLAAGEITGALILLLLISAGGIALCRKWPWLLCGWLWYLGMLVPAIGLVQVGSQAHADRYTYLPQIGLYIVLTWAAAELLAGKRIGRVALGVAATVILAGLMVGAHAQTVFWRNSETLWTRALACTSGNIVAHDNLGNALYEQGRVEEAIIHYQKALEIKPDHAETHYNLGNAYMRQENVDGAIAQFQQAVAAWPDYVSARYNLGSALIRKGRGREAIVQLQKVVKIQPDDWVARNNLGNALFQSGQADEAIAQFQTVLKLKPDDTEARYNLGFAQFQKGHTDEAITQFEKALESRPNSADTHYRLANALVQAGRVNEAISHYESALQYKTNFTEAHYNLGVALGEMGKAAEARAQYESALALNPDYVEAQNNLAWLLATSTEASVRNGMKAVTLAEQANQLAGGADLDIAGTLAAAYAEAGRFDDAKLTAQKAIALAQAVGQPEQAAQLKSQLKLYEAGLPFREKDK